MEKSLTKKDRFFNNINLTGDDDVYVGIDVHKKIPEALNFPRLRWRFRLRSTSYDVTGGMTWGGGVSQLLMINYELRSSFA